MSWTSVGEEEPGRFLPRGDVVVPLRQNGSRNGNGHRNRQPALVDLRPLQIEDVTWLVKPFVPQALMILQGHGGIGKGTLTCRWGAELSRQGQLVVYAVAEDSYTSAVKPRLLAAGADLEYIRGLDWSEDGLEDALTIPDDIPQLAELIQAEQIKLVVIDPILSHLNSQIESYKDHLVKRALSPLAKLADQLGCAICGVHHFTKDTSKGAVLSGQASGAFSNTARLVVAMAHDPEENTHVIEVVKSNLGKTGARVSYLMESVPLEGLEEGTTMLVEGGSNSKSVEEILAAERAAHARVPAARVRELILAALAEGEQSRKMLNDRVYAETDVNPDSVYKYGLAPLRTEGRIACRKQGFGADGDWFWYLRPDFIAPNEESPANGKDDPESGDFPF